MIVCENLESTGSVSTLSEIHRVLKDDGVFLMQDIAGSSKLENNYDHPIVPFMYTISCMHCKSVSLAQNGAGLGAMWGKELACKMLEDAGFVNTRVQQLDHDIINYYYISTKRKLISGILNIRLEF